MDCRTETVWNTDELLPHLQCTRLLTYLQTNKLIKRKYLGEQILFSSLTNWSVGHRGILIHGNDIGRPAIRHFIQQVTKWEDVNALCGLCNKRTHIIYRLGKKGVCHTLHWNTVLQISTYNYKLLLKYYKCFHSTYYCSEFFFPLGSADLLTMWWNIRQPLGKPTSKLFMKWSAFSPRGEDPIGRNSVPNMETTTEKSYDRLDCIC